MKEKNIGIVVGSIRKESFSKKVADLIAERLPTHFKTHFIDIGKLDMYNQDLDDSDAVPIEWTEFRSAVKQMDGYIFVTPEYNRSVPPILKNAMDIASRPYGKNSWAKKPGAIISVSPGNIGGFGANHHLRQITVFLDIYLMQQPEAYIGSIADSLDGRRPKNERFASFINTLANGIADWFGKF